MKTPLIADKQLFRIWYEFYRIALASNDSSVVRALKKSARFYEEWGTDRNLHFDDWWKSHSHLFSDDSRIQVYESGSPRKINCVYLEIPTTKSQSDLVKEFRKILPIAVKSLKRGRKLPPTHKYAPTEIQGLKRDSLRMMLDLQKNVFINTSLKGESLRNRVQSFFGSERYKKKTNIVPMAFRLDANKRHVTHQDEADRNIRRYRQKASKLILNVASGVFPGKY